LAALQREVQKASTRQQTWCREGTTSLYISFNPLSVSADGLRMPPGERSRSIVHAAVGIYV